MGYAIQFGVNAGVFNLLHENYMHNKVSFGNPIIYRWNKQPVAFIHFCSIGIQEFELEVSD